MARKRHDLSCEGIDLFVVGWYCWKDSWWEKKSNILGNHSNFFCFLRAAIGSNVSMESKLLRTPISYRFFSFSALRARILISTASFAFSRWTMFYTKSFFASTLPALFLPRILFFFFFSIFLSAASFSAFDSAAITSLLAVSTVPNLFGFKQIVVLGI